MFAKSFIALAAVASFAVAAPVDVEQRGAPASWAWGYLEDYDTYHIRYLALECQNKHKTAFFQSCCRPLLSTQTLADRKAECTPSDDATASVVASLAGSAPATTSTATETESATTKAATTTAATNDNYVAPVPTTTATPTPAYVAPTTTSTKPAATTAAASTNNNNSQYTGGYATYFYQGGNAGACGTVHGDYDQIAAIDQAQWGDYNFGSGSNTCGRWLTVCNTNNGKCTSVMVADVCPTCANGNSLDLSVGAFKAIANEADGMVPIKWSWN